MRRENRINAIVEANDTDWDTLYNKKPPAASELRPYVKRLLAPQGPDPDLDDAPQIQESLNTKISAELQHVINDVVSNEVQTTCAKISSSSKPS